MEKDQKITEILEKLKHNSNLIDSRIQTIQKSWLCAMLKFDYFFFSEKRTIRLNLANEDEIVNFMSNILMFDKHKSDARLLLDLPQIESKYREFNNEKFSDILHDCKLRLEIIKLNKEKEKIVDGFKKFEKHLSEDFLKKRDFCSLMEEYKDFI